MSEGKDDQLSHIYTCEGCGKVIDKRDLGTVLSHGWVNKTTGKIECSDVAIDITYNVSKRNGDNVEWTKKKQRLDLN